MTTLPKNLLLLTNNIKSEKHDLQLTKEQHDFNSFLLKYFTIKPDLKLYCTFENHNFTDTNSSWSIDELNYYKLLSRFSKPNYNFLFLYTKHTPAKVYCLDVDKIKNFDYITKTNPASDFVRKEILELLLSNFPFLTKCPFTLSRNKKLFHFYFIISDLDPYTQAVNIMKNKDFEFDLLKDTKCVAELRNTEMFNYNDVLPVFKWNQISDFFDTKRMNIQNEENKLERKKKLDERCSIVVKLTDDDISYYSSLIDILSVSRATNYDEWSRVGWCLANIFQKSEDGLILFQRFSEKASNYDEFSVEDLYDKSKENGILGVGSLIRWAKEDNITKYNELTINRYSNELNTTLTNEHIAKMYYELYACDNIKLVSYGKDNIQSYIFNENNCLWEHKKGIEEIIGDLSKVLNPEIVDIITSLTKQTKESDSEDIKIKRENALKQYKKVLVNIGSTTFRKHVYTILQRMIKDEKFVSKINKDSNFLSLKNKKKLSLIDGKIYNKKREDYWSIELETEYDENADTTLAEELFRTTFVTEEKKESKELVEYCQIVFGYYLTGNTNHRKFYIHNGSGSNGKSFIFNALKKILQVNDGKSLYENVNKQAFITEKNRFKSATAPELFDIRHSRVCVSSEPEKGEILNSSVLKNVTGNDEIVIRGLYQNDFTKFFTQSKICMLTNFRPKFNCEDEAIYARICIIPYYNKFTDDNEDTNKRKHKMLNVDKYGIINDTDFKEEFIQSLFKFLVIGAMKSNVLNRDYKEPKECMELRETYKKENDVFTVWMNENYEKITDTEFKKLETNKRILKTNLIQQYKYYCERNNIDYEKNKIGKRIEEEYGIKKISIYFVLVKQIETNTEREIE
jgi:P4 family phage/plasmid primase-like protien